jgi:branched-chain amino acid aminotransferase
MSGSSLYPVGYQRGTFAPSGDLAVHAECLAMRYAISAFEGVRGYVQEGGGAVRFFALDAHLARLGESLSMVRVDAPPIAPLEDVAQELVDRNTVQEDCYLRIAANATSEGTLRTPARAEFTVTLRPMGRRGLEGDALAVQLSGWRKPSDAVFPQRAKVVANYAGPRLADLEARASGYDVALLRSWEGHLAEAPTANLFLVQQGVVRTPRVCDSILAGITRATVLEICEELGVPAEECALSCADARASDEAFLSGTAIELAPIGRFDDVVLPDRRTVFPAIRDRYFARVRAQCSAPAR